MEFVNHNHPLILNENFHGGEEDACYLYREQLRYTPIYSVYRCSLADHDGVECVNLFVHKSCAELPLKITDYFMHPEHPITLVRKTDLSRKHCSICFWGLLQTIVYSCESCDLTVCLRCATSPLIYHPSHNQHALALVQRQASFRCDACGTEASSWSSCKCNTCPYWIHTSCAILSSSFQSEFHIHPLLLAYSFPQQYRKFRQRCKICRVLMKPTRWFYYCAGCRFFAHLECINAAPKMTMSPSADFRDMVHLPSRDESSLNLLRQLFIQQMMINQREAEANLTWSFYPISTVSAEVAVPSKEVIHHWSHHQHPLILRNKCSTLNIQLITAKNDDEEAEDDTFIVLCDGCTNPINSSKTSYYECHTCKYFLHRYCAELPKQMQSYQLPYKFAPLPINKSYPIILSEIFSSYLFKCNGCNYLKSGIHIATDNGDYKLDIGCATLPSEIKHEAHRHPLTQTISSWDYYQEVNSCDACALRFCEKELYFNCDDCFFKVHVQCALSPHKLKHRWDSHPLTLITPENIVEDHPHDFNCEHCSEDIDTNYLFYHCNLCDLSCHMSCINKFYRYSGINFRASNIQLRQELHEHGLELVLNKRKRCCGNCHGQLFHSPALQCTKCNFIICLSCVDADEFD